MGKKHGKTNWDLEQLGFSSKVSHRVERQNSVTNSGSLTYAHIFYPEVIHTNVFILGTHEISRASVLLRISDYSDIRYSNLAEIWICKLTRLG